MYESEYDGVLFCEGSLEGARVIQHIKIEIGGVFQSAQLRSLNDVKREMAAQASSRGGNAILNFRYGQRSVGFLRSLFQRDDVNWYGEGSIALLHSRRQKSRHQDEG